MLRELGYSALFLISMLASSAVAEPDTSIHLKADLSIKPESVRLTTVLEEIIKPVDFDMTGTVQAITTDSADGNVLITSDEFELKSFDSARNYTYSSYLLVAGADNSTITPFDGAAQSIVWDNSAAVPIFEEKSALAAEYIQPLALATSRPYVARMTPRLLLSQADEAVADPVIPVNAIYRFRKPIRLPPASKDPIPLVMESYSPINREVEMLKGKEKAANAALLEQEDPTFTQQSVYDAAKGIMYVFDQNTKTVGYQKGLNKPQQDDPAVPPVDPVVGPPITWCPTSVFGGLNNRRENEEKAIYPSTTNPRLTMMTLCETGRRTVLALAFDDGRIILYDPFRCGILNIIERRCRCTRFSAYPIWMEWCCRTNRLIVQYRKVERVYVDEAAYIYDNGVRQGFPQADIVNNINEQEQYDENYFAALDSNPNRITFNRYFINVYKVDDITEFAAEPVLMHTIRSCRIRFVRYCCTSGHLIIVLRDGRNSILVVLDEQMRVVARKAVVSVVEQMEVTCCSTRLCKRDNCECVIYLATRPHATRSADLEAEAEAIVIPQQLHVLCIRKVVDTLLEVEARAKLCVDGLIDIQAYGQAEALVNVRLPLDLFENEDRERHRDF